jgi:hypothetical protein
VYILFPYLYSAVQILGTAKCVCHAEEANSYKIMEIQSALECIIAMVSRWQHFAWETLSYCSGSLGFWTLPMVQNSKY